MDTPIDVSGEFYGIPMQITCCSPRVRALFNKPTGTGRTATRSFSTDGTKHALLHEIATPSVRVPANVSLLGSFFVQRQEEQNNDTD